CALMSALLLWVGAAHLISWLGRPALLGAFVGLTPTAVFSSSVVSTSGVEISAAFALSCIGVVAIRRAESLARPRTQVLLAVVGSALILSRQLGVVTFGAIIGLVLLRVGWGPLWSLIRKYRPTFLASVLVLVAAAASIVWWERGFDHPNQTGSAFDSGALGGFSQTAFSIVRSGIAQFGWLDTQLFRWGITAWLLLAIVLIGLAIVLGDTADRWSLVGWLAATWVVAYVTYATIFYPIHAGVQGRHMIPFFMMCPVLAGVVVVEKLQQFSMPAARRIFGITATVMAVLQLTSLYVNARRYSVGAHGPLFFFGKSQWQPPAGWTPWTLLSILGAVLLAGLILACRPSSDAALVKELRSVER
ncbi:MAG: conserved hypothetical rane protein, partial [Streptosporangiaceae bacterium]|nr:conserved hypothetical rane protein [Streptosporangiaceae bacterium]